MSSDETTQTSDEIDITPGSHPQLVALRFGRRFNELLHQMELAWLVDGHASQRVGQIWRDLRMLSRMMTESETQRHTWASVLDNEQEFWESNFQKEWHIDSNWELRKDLAALRRDGVTNSGSRSVSEVLEEAITGISGYFVRFSQLLLEEFGNEHTETISFGHWLDQIIHPSRPRRFMVMQDELANSSEFQWETEQVPSATNVPSFGIELSTEFPAMDCGWENELQVRWEQLGFGRPSFSTRDLGSSAEVVRTVETRFRQELAYVTESEAVETGHLGLTTDGNWISRDGYPAVELSTRLNLGLFHVLAASRHRPVSFQDLSERWEDMGGNEADPAEVTVRGQIRRLRLAIQPLNVEIQNSRGLGWRLVNGTRNSSR